MKHYETSFDALSDLKKRGYEADFETPENCLYCGDLDIRQNPEAFHVDEVYRFEGDANAGDKAIVLAISSLTGVKGTLVNTYAQQAENFVFDNTGMP